MEQLSDMKEITKKDDRAICHTQMEGFFFFPIYLVLKYCRFEDALIITTLLSHTLHKRSYISDNLQGAQSGTIYNS